MRFITDLPGPVDHVLVSGGGPHCVPFAELDTDRIRQGVQRIVFTVLVAHMAGHVATHRRPAADQVARLADGLPQGHSIFAVTAAMPALARTLAFELAPMRVNVLAPGCVDTPLSPSLLGDELDVGREQLPQDLADGTRRRSGGPRRLGPAITGATFDIDGGQQLAEG